MVWRDLKLFAKFAWHVARHGYPERLQQLDGVQFPDLNYSACYDLSDLPYYTKQYDLARAFVNMADYAKANEIATSIDNRIERMWQGQYIAPTDHKPLMVGKKYDLVLQAGLNSFASAIMENRGTRFNHMATGDGTTEPSLGDLSLEHEMARDSMDEGQAFQFASGSILRWGKIMQPGFATHDVTEAGLVSGPQNKPHFFMNRALFPVEERIKHVVHSDFYAISINISLSSV